MRKRHPVVYSQAEVRLMLQACPNDIAWVRNKAMLAVMYRAGLRAGEVLALMPGDIDPVRNLVYVRHGKGAKHRTVGIDEGGLDYVAKWLKARREWVSPADWELFTLFCTVTGGPVADCYLRATMRRIRRKLGWPKHIHPHAFRHTHAAELAAEGVPMNTIQKQLGHASLATTGIYLDHIGAHDLSETARKRAEWRAQWVPISRLG